MKIKLTLGTLALGALLAFGCGKNEAVKAAEEMADGVCKCKDLDCAMKAAAEGAKKLEKFKDAKGTKKDAEAIIKAGQRAAECTKKLASAGMPAPAENK